jgi:hypothetical protein
LVATAIRKVVVIRIVPFALNTELVAGGRGASTGKGTSSGTDIPCAPALVAKHAAANANAATTLIAVSVQDGTIDVSDQRGIVAGKEAQGPTMPQRATTVKPLAQRTAGPLMPAWRAMAHLKPHAPTKIRAVICSPAESSAGVPAYSQGRDKGGRHSATGQQTDEQKKKAAEVDSAYKAALGRIPDQKPSAPWAALRK